MTRCLFIARENRRAKIRLAKMARSVLYRLTDTQLRGRLRSIFATLVLALEKSRSNAGQPPA